MARLRQRRHRHRGARYRAQSEIAAATISGGAGIGAQPSKRRRRQRHRRNQRRYLAARRRNGISEAASAQPLNGASWRSNISITSGANGAAYQRHQRRRKHRNGVAACGAGGSAGGGGIMSAGIMASAVWRHRQMAASLTAAGKMSPSSSARSMASMASWRRRSERVMAAAKQHQ